MVFPLSSEIANQLSFLSQKANFIKQQLEDRFDAGKSFHAFVKQAWNCIESEEFVDGWHIQAICEHLEAASRREIRKLLINIPPRLGKTNLISIMWPAWVWINHPKEKFLYASCGIRLAHSHSVTCRRLISSDWYQSRWGDRFKLSIDQNTKGRFDNDKSGYRIALSIGANVLGEGGNIKVLDDPNAASNIWSDVTRESTNNWISGVWSTRQNNPRKSVDVLVQQRLHAQDVSGYWMNLDTKNELVKLILPMEFETSRRCKTIILPSTYGKIWHDPRTKEGELLWPERCGPEELAQRKRELKTVYNISGQLQQRPAPEEGGIIKKGWFKWWKQAAPPKINHVIQSWDTALEAEDTNSYSACTTWGLFNDDHNVANVILLSVWRGRIEFPELRTTAQKLYKDYRDDGKILGFIPDGTHVPDLVLVESKASGAPLVQELIRAGIPAIRFNPTKYGNKFERVRYITHLIEAGRVWVPARPPDYTSLRGFADLMVEQCAIFPKDEESRDLVDTMSQVLIRLKDGGWISHPEDEEYSDTSLKNENPLYYG